MPLKFLFANNVRSHLTAPLTSSATTFTITAGDGAKFPSPDESKGERVALTIVDDLGNMEIVYVTKRTADSFTVLRAQEGTTAKAFERNAVVELRITAASLNQISVAPPANVVNAICTTAPSSQIKDITVGDIDVNKVSVMYVEFYLGNTNNNIMLNVNGETLAVLNPEDTVTGAIDSPPYPNIMFVKEYMGWRAYNPLSKADVTPYTSTTFSPKSLLINVAPTISNGKMSLRSIDALTVGKTSSTSPYIFKVDGQVTAAQFNGNLKGLITPARSIDGILFAANADVIRFAVSTTAADVAEKVVSIPNLPKNIPEGTIILVYPTITTTVTPITLKVNDSPAYPMWHSQSQITNWVQGKASWYCFYDSKWQLVYPHIVVTRVTQNVSTGNAEYPMLASYTASLAVSSTTYSRFAKDVTLNPSTGTITAKVFNGVATNATKWAGSTKYVSTAGPSGGVNGDIWFQYI